MNTFFHCSPDSPYPPLGDGGGCWYEIENINTIDSPALVVYKDRVKENISLLLQMVGNDPSRVRPHVKTNKISEVCQMMMDAGIDRFKCATIAEAEMLAMIEAKDVLLAYQPVGPKAERFVELIKTYPETKFSCVFDTYETAAYLSKLAIENNYQIDLFIDLNTGMNRTGIKPVNALQLFKDVASLPNIAVIGLHGYDGHIRDTDTDERKAKADAAFKEMTDLEAAIESVTKQKLIIVAGGSPTFPVHAKRLDMECSPGTFVFWDWGYKHQTPDEPFDYAALVITRVISIVDETHITTDLGHKSVAAENPFPRVHFLNAPEATPVGQSEEHLVLKVADSGAYKVGDVFYGVPVHICPTVALYDSAVVVEDHKAVGSWKVVSRDRKITV